MSVSIAMPTTSNKFTVTNVCSKSRDPTYRRDVGPMDRQFESVKAARLHLKRCHENQQQQACQERTKDDHTKMLLQLLTEANRYHAVNTKKHVCKISKIVCPPNEGFPAGLSEETMKALVTDVDIVMNDSDADNYQHALSAMAALSLWS